MDKNSAKLRASKAALIAAVVIAIVAMYFVSYYALVHPVITIFSPAPVHSIHNGSLPPGATIQTSPRYHSNLWKYIPFGDRVEVHQMLEIIFVPANRLDRRIRPDVWK